MKSIFWKLFLADGWYFITVDGDHDHTAKPAFWNGYVWENRTQVIPDNRVRRVVGKVPEKTKQGNDHGNKTELPDIFCNSRYALAGFARLKGRLDGAARSHQP